MSNNLVSQYPIPDRQVVQMGHGSNSLNLPASEMHAKMVVQVPSNSESHHFSLEPVSSDPTANTSMMQSNPTGRSESSGGTMNSSPVWTSDIQNNKTGESISFPIKRKAEVEQALNYSNSQQSPLHNKRPAYTRSDDNPPGFLQPSAPHRRTAPAPSRLGSPAMSGQPSQNKKMSRNDSMSGKSGLQRGQTGKRQTAQVDSASKVRPESLEGVRSKMRESLAAALALAYRKQDSASNPEKNHNDTSNNSRPMNSQASGITASTGGGQVPVSGSVEVFPSNESTPLNKTNDSQVFSAELPASGRSGTGEQTFQGFHYSLPDEDTSFGDNFFVKDDLLQGNGLSWAFEFDVHMGEGKEAQHAEKPQPVKAEAQEPREEVVILTPENLASQIEDELFKLFGDVNKKYKEKGRSLIFNLKDRNNPELRERVMSGEISPERLCSMTAEELASKELSEWRMAKAEELAQMKVLPDTEVDIRRLVRKTHKGEFQVEVEHDDGISAEVSGGTSVLTRPQPKKEDESHSPSESSVKDREKAADQGSSLEGHDLSGSLIIPTDGTDLMQGMIVDELKDAEFLPPIVSLDEFMESLKNEPPFENLPVDAGKKSPILHVDSPKNDSSSRASNRASEIRRDASAKRAALARKHDLAIKSSESLAKQKVLPSNVPKVDYIWEGILELTISSSVTVGGLFLSGEKTSTKDWPRSLEIKGRVRLDAFEKFLQELPMSRTRAVMILHIVLKDSLSDEQRSNLSEAIDSYTTDERLGYAEPLPGVELYLCPQTSRMFEMLNKFMPKERPEPGKNGLIGVVVWRRPHISNTISPNSSSHHKNTNKQPFSRVQDSPNVNANTPTRSPYLSSSGRLKPQIVQDDDDDDDIPPGFGPPGGAGPVAVAKDDDDLPEFNFSGGLNPPRQMLNLPTRPVDQVRELIKKYGQSDNSGNSGNLVDNRGLGIEPWNDDDDDDIPEWRPQAPQAALHQPPFAVAHSHQPPVHLRPMAPMVTQQPPVRLGHLAPPGGVRGHPPGHVRGRRWRQY